MGARRLASAPPRNQTATIYPPSLSRPLVPWTCHDKNRYELMSGSIDIAPSAYSVNFGALNGLRKPPFIQKNGFSQKTVYLYDITSIIARIYLQQPGRYLLLEL